MRRLIGEINSLLAPFGRLLETQAIAVDLPSLRGLAALAALARHRRQGAAAAALGVSRSALSHRIADLEEELGVALISRVGRVCALTDEGLALLAALGDALERIETAVAPLQRRWRQLRVSTVATFASNWLLPRLPDFQRAHPDVELAIHTTMRVVDLGQEDFDCAIRHGQGEWDGLEARLLFRETLLPVVSPSLPSRPSARWPIIAARTRFGDWPLWWRATAQPQDCPSPVMMVENRAQALEAALAGAGVAITDARYVNGLIGSGRLAALGPSIPLAEGYYFVRRRQARNPRHVDCLGSWLQEQAASC